MAEAAGNGECTDKYRFQNGHFELIGFSSESGKPEDIGRQ
jgi:hypothetical protein